jgi:hypothetical protein
MKSKDAPRPIARAVVGALLAVSALSLSACGDTAGPEQGADVESVQEEADDAEGYDGPYDGRFSDDLNSYVGKKVTVSADVSRQLSPTAFTIAGTDDTSVEPLLILGADPATQITEDLTVKVTGTVVTNFDLATVEEEKSVDLTDEMFADFEGEPYIDAITVDTSVASDQ